MKMNAVMVKLTRSIGLLLGIVVLALFVLIAPSGLRAAGDNVVINGDFESGATGWMCKSCSLNVGAPAQNGSAGQWVATSRTSRAQLYQSNIQLEPNTTYELSFWARSSNGNDVRVTLMQQLSPRTNYGIKSQAFNLTANGTLYTYSFTTVGFSGPVSDARLQFQADLGKGVQYSIDDIALVADDAPPPPPPPPGDGTEDEILVFNRGSNSVPFSITKTLSGFVEDKPPTGDANANWVTGQFAGFADGTLYYRARVLSIPVNQPGMRLGFCFWEQGFDHEQCRGQVIDGIPGTEMEWQHTLDDMWVKADPINWANPRTKHGFLVRNDRNKPVSAKKGWNWNGENPDEWYPMGIHYTVVLVKEGGTFDGWQNYGW